MQAADAINRYAFWTRDFKAVNAEPLLSTNQWIPFRLKPKDAPGATGYDKVPMTHTGYPAKDLEPEMTSISNVLFLCKGKGYGTHYHGAGFAFDRYSDIVGIDIDTYKNMNGSATVIEMVARCRTLTTQSLSGGKHLYVRLDPNSALSRRIGHLRQGLLGCIEIYNAHGYFAETLDVVKDEPIIDGTDVLTFILDKHEEIYGPLAPGIFLDELAAPVAEVAYADLEALLAAVKRINKKAIDTYSTPHQYGESPSWGQRLRDIAGDMRKAGANWDLIAAVLSRSPLVTQSYDHGHGQTRPQKAERLLRSRHWRNKVDMNNDRLAAARAHDAMPGSERRTMLERMMVAPAEHAMPALPNTPRITFDTIKAAVETLRAQIVGLKAHGRTKFDIAAIEPIVKDAVLIGIHRDVNKWPELRHLLAGVGVDGLGYDAKGKVDDDSGALHMMLARLVADLDKGTDIVLDKSNFMGCARKFIEIKGMNGAHIALRRWRGVFYIWTGTRYHAIPKESMTNALWMFLDSSKILVKVKVEGGEIAELHPFKPTITIVANINDALAAIVDCPDVDAPFWIDGGDGIAPRDIIPLHNGLYVLSTDTLLPHTPLFFNTTASDVAFDRDAPAPAAWLDFMARTFKDDQQSVDTLHEILGYLVSPDTSQQKLFMFYGPRRTGKGTVMKMLELLVGSASYTAGTLKQLSSDFGLWQALGKGVYGIPDAAITGRTDIMAGIEHIKTISGEDTVSVPRKNLSAYVGRLGVRFVITANDILALPDDSGALAGRTIMMHFAHSVFGHEDTKLFDKLRMCATGILNVVLDGLRRLNKRGSFVQPATAQDALDAMEELGSPLQSFVKEYCEIHPAYHGQKSGIYAAWKVWCDTNRQAPGSLSWFSRRLYSTYQGVKSFYPLDPVTNKQITCFIGIRLNGAVNEVEIANQASRTMKFVGKT